MHHAYILGSNDAIITRLSVSNDIVIQAYLALEDRQSDHEVTLAY